MNIDQTITFLKPATSKAGKLDPAQKLKLEKAVREFESVFVGYLLKSMRNTVQKADNQTDSFGGDMLESMFDVELARHVSKNSNLGLAEMLYRKMTDEELPKPVKSGAQAAHPSTQNGKSTQLRAGTVKVEAARELSRPAEPSEKSKISQTTQNVLGKNTEQPGRHSMIAVQPVTASRDAIRVDQTIARSKDIPKHQSIEQRLNQYGDYITEAADKHGVSQHLIKAVIASESAGRANVRSPKDAKGLMQLIDTTAAAMGVKNVWDPRENILGGAKYLKQLLEQFDGDEKLAVASYNAGPANIVKHGGIPPFKETKAYVARVMNFLQVFAQQENNNE